MEFEPVPSKIDCGLKVNVICISRSNCWCRERLVYIVAGEKVSVPGLQLGIASYRIADDEIDFTPHKVAIVGIDAVASPRSCGEAAAGRASHGVEIVAGICEPESLSFKSQ